MKRLSLVTPTYNQAKYISECVDSVLPQIRRHDEYIVVNDGSTDETIEVLKKYADDPAFQLFSQDNKGQVSTLNERWGLSTAEYLGYLSSDDALMPGALDSLLGFLEQNPNIVAVYPDFYLINAKSEVTATVSNGDFNRQLIFEKMICQPGPCAIFRRSAFLAAGEWRADLRITPDLEFWSRLALVGEIARYPEKLAKYRVHEGSQSTGNMPVSAADEILRIPKIFADTLKDSGFHYSYAAALGSAYILAGFNHYKGNRFFTAVSLLLRGYLIRVFCNLVICAGNFFKGK